MARKLRPGHLSLAHLAAVQQGIAALQQNSQRPTHHSNSLPRYWRVRSLIKRAIAAYFLLSPEEERVRDRSARFTCDGLEAHRISFSASPKKFSTAEIAGLQRQQHVARLAADRTHRNALPLGRRRHRNRLQFQAPSFGTRDQPRSPNRAPVTPDRIFAGGVAPPTPSHPAFPKLSPACRLLANRQPRAPDRRRPNRRAAR